MSGPRIQLGVTVFWLRVPLNQRFTKRLHEKIPRRAHTYDDRRHAWKIESKYLPDVKQLLFCFWDVVRIVERDKSEQVIDHRGREVRQESLFGT
jgi:hypothetical protein